MKRVLDSDFCFVQLDTTVKFKWNSVGRQLDRSSIGVQRADTNLLSLARLLHESNLELEFGSTTNETSPLEQLCLFVALVWYH